MVQPGGPAASSRSGRGKGSVESTSSVSMVDAGGCGVEVGGGGVSEEDAESTGSEKSASMSMVGAGGCSSIEVGEGESEEDADSAGSEKSACAFDISLPLSKKT